MAAWIFASQSGSGTTSLSRKIVDVARGAVDPVVFLFVAQVAGRQQTKARWPVAPWAYMVDDAPDRLLVNGLGIEQQHDLRIPG